MKKIIAALILAALSVSAHAGLWAVGGNAMEGFIDLYDDKRADCPKEYPFRASVRISGRAEVPLCYEINSITFKFLNIANGKTFVLPWSIFEPTDYGRKHVLGQ